MFLLVHTFGVAHIASFPPQHFYFCGAFAACSLVQKLIFLSPVLAEFLKAICSNLNVLHRFQIKSREEETRWNCTFSTVTGKLRNNINKNVRQKMDKAVTS